MIRARGLSKRYGRSTVVHEASFEVPAGRVTGLLGPNGAGKTTIIRLMLGLVRGPGTTTFCGRRLADAPYPSRLVTAVLDTGTGLHPRRTGRDHLRMVAAACQAGPEQVEDVLERVGLAPHAHRRVKGYSLGMRQRLLLAAALLPDPAVLVLDEPGNGLDPEGLRWLRALLRERADSGRTVLLSSHQLTEVSLLVDDVVVVGAGSVRRCAAVGDLLDDVTPSCDVRTPDPDLLGAALTGSGALVSRSGPWLSVRGLSTDEVGLAASSLQVPVLELVARRRTLEEAFLEIVSSGGGAEPLSPAPRSDPS